MYEQDDLNNEVITEIEITDKQDNLEEIITEIPIKEEYIKLSSFLKFCGAAQTGGCATELIKSEKIKVNDEICTQRGRKLYPGYIVITETEKFKVCKL